MLTEAKALLNYVVLHNDICHLIKLLPTKQTSTHKPSTLHYIYDLCCNFWLLL